MFITEKQLDNWKESMIGAMKENFYNDGSLSACAMIYGMNGKHKIYSIAFETEKDKENFNEFIRDEIKSSGALAYIFISEAWATSYKKEDIEKYKNPDGTYKKPSKSTDRIEVVMVVFETSLKNEAITFQIDRSGEKPILTKETRQYRSQGGRFVDVLRKPIMQN